MNMMTKDELRKALKEKRASIPPEEKKELDQAIIGQILASEAYQNADILLLYAPIQSEINLLPLVRSARKDGKSVAFPRCDAEQGTMQFYLLLEDARLTPGAYGIPEPPSDAPLCIPSDRSLCILPALTFDPFGMRIGYGKGYYDRFLTTFRGITAGALYEKMMIKRVPAEPHDLPAELLFTERKCLASAPITAAKSTSKKAPKKKKSSASIDLPKLKKELAQKSKELVSQLSSTAKKAKESFSQNDGVKPLHAPAILVLCTFVLLLLSRLIDPYLTNRENDFIVVVLLQILIFAIPAVLYGKLKGEKFTSRARLTMFRPSQICFLFCVLILMITGSLLCGILTGGITAMSGSFTLYSTFVARMSDGGQIIYAVFAYGILPAFCEEIIYRAILCAEYERFGAGVAIAASSLFFALLHFSFPLFLTYLFLGVVLAGSLYATRSFFAPLLLHLFYNIFCLFGQPYLSAFYIHAGSNEIFLFCLISVFLLFAAFAAGEARKIYHIYANKNKDSSYTVSHPMRQLPKRLFYAMRSPAVLPCILIWLVMAIIDVL